MNMLEKIGLTGFTYIFLLVVIMTYIFGGSNQNDLLDVLFTVVGIALGAAWIASIMRKQPHKNHKFE